MSFPDEGAGFPSRDTWAFPLRGLLLCFIHHQATLFLLLYLPRWGVRTLRSTLGRKSTIDGTRVQLSAELPRKHFLHHGSAPNDWKWCI